MRARSYDESSRGVVRVLCRGRVQRACSTPASERVATRHKRFRRFSTFGARVNLVLFESRIATEFFTFPPRSSRPLGFGFGVNIRMDYPFWITHTMASRSDGSGRNLFPCYNSRPHMPGAVAFRRLSAQVRSRFYTKVETKRTLIRYSSLSF